jgi:hypothetical protein
MILSPCNFLNVLWLPFTEIGSFHFPSAAYYLQFTHVEVYFSFLYVARLILCNIGWFLYISNVHLYLDAHVLLGQGDQRSPGIIPLAVKDAFSIIQETPNREFLLRVSYLEIYNEVCHCNHICIIASFTYSCFVLL